MRQYLDAKQQYRDAILFFRMGDFYEMFYEDALVAARALDLTLTSRSKDGQGTSIPMCGVPHHALDTYLARLVKKGISRRHLRSGRRPEKSQGHRQARDRARRVARHADRFAASRRARARVSAVAAPQSDTSRVDSVVGVALLDLTTGEFSCAEYAGPAGLQALADEVMVLRPREIVAPVDLDLSRVLLDGAGRPAAGDTRRAVDVRTRIGAPRRSSISSAPTASKASVSMAIASAVSAAGALLHYLRDTQKADLAHVRSDRLQDIGRLPAHRRGHAEASRGRRIDGRRPRRHAAPRDRSDGHRHGGPPAARLAAATARRRSIAFATGWTPSRSSRFAAPTAASSARS